MKPAAFKYFDPETIPEAVALLAQYGGDGKVLAGGQSLMPMLNMRLARVEALIDLNRVGDLSYILPCGSGVAIGAMTRQRRLESDRLVAERAPLLPELVTLIAHAQIRSRGTVGGSVAHGDPGAELPAAVLALDVELIVVGPDGERTLTPDELYLGYLVTALEPEEVLRELRFPSLPPGTGCSVKEIARRHGDFALAGVIAVLTYQPPHLSDARLAYFGLGGRPLRFPDVERLLVGAVPSEAVFDAAARLAAASVQPGEDIHGTVAYRRSLAGTVTRRALSEALGRAKGGLQ
jgi:aerobic carbon-monoxide dehydrogenase medium subunit